MSPPAPHVRAWYVLAGGGLLLVGLVGVMALDARRAEGALQRAEGRAPALRDAVVAGDAARAARVVDLLQADTRRADRATSGPLWDVASRLPLLGRSVTQTRVLTGTARQFAADVLPHLLDATADLRPLLHRSGPGIDVMALRRASPDLTAALARVTPVVTTLEDLPSRGVLPVVGAARQRVLTRAQALESGLRELAAAGRVGPAMLGADGPRRYFVGFQNNAESRGTGGLLGAYAVVTADRGRVSVDRLGSDLDLHGLPSPRLDLGADFRSLYGHDARRWQNTNMSPHFPYAARLWLDMWQQRTGEHLDGALATDPVALSYLLDTTGPVRLPGGGAVRAADVVAQTEQAAYVRYASDDRARKEYLVGVARAVLDRLLGPRAPSGSGVVQAIARAASERRFMLFSAHPAEQSQLGGTALSGEVPVQPGPFAFLVVNNSAANKIDYYLRRSLRYDLGACHKGTRTSTLTAVLRNDVPATRLPRFVVGRLDRVAPPGSTSLLVSMHVTQGAALTLATLDGRPVAVLPGRERGHPVFVLKVELPRGRERALVLHLVEPAAAGEPVVPVQSLAQDQSTVVSAATCS